MTYSAACPLLKTIMLDIELAIFVYQISTLSPWYHNYEPQFHWLGLFIPSLPLIVNTWAHCGSPVSICFVSTRKLTSQTTLHRASKPMRWYSILISEPFRCLYSPDLESWRQPWPLWPIRKEPMVIQYSQPIGVKIKVGHMSPRWGGRAGVDLFSHLAIAKSPGSYTYCWFPLTW